jgi:putative ABC transport system permease protein
MFKNYILTAIRSTLRHRLYAIINILGLAIGLAACMLIILVIRHETSYDDFIPNAQNIYRMEATANIPGRDPSEGPNYVGPTKDLLPQDYPEVAEVLRITQRPGNVIKDGENFDQRIDYVDDNFFKVFQLPLIEGTYDEALAAPSSIVLSEESARKYLGDGPYLGREIIVNHVYERTHIVSGVMQDIPENSHMNMEFMIPHDRRVYEANSSRGITDLERWNGLPFFVYVMLREGAAIGPMEQTINAWVDRYFPADISALVNIPGSELWTPRFVQVPDIHLYSPAQFGMKPPGSITTLVSFGAIAAMILVIASINFMNLATARSTLRAREVAVRKVMGAARMQLFTQFETESMIFTVISLVMATFMTELILPYFNEYTQLGVPFSLILDPVTLSNILALTLFVGLGAGLHPALVLSSLRPSRVLMSNKSSSPANSKLRSSLVIMQFTISAALIIGTAIIYLQTDFARSRALGYSTQNTILVRGLSDPQVRDSAEAFKNRVALLPGVTAAALSGNAPGDGSGSGASLRVPGEADRVVFFYQAVDYDLFDLYEIEAVAGRLFTEEFQGDALYRRGVPGREGEENVPQQISLILNVSATRRLGFENPEDALGLVMFSGTQDEVAASVVGVVPDILYSDPRGAFQPEIYYLSPQEYRTLNVRFETDDPEALGLQIDALWNEMFPGVRPIRNYLDENIALSFQFEDIMGQLLAIFSGLAILVASMGLFGLSSFTVMRRTKEIGLRKVMGATSGNIVKLLIKQMSVPVIIANVIAWPIGWYAMAEWLETFTYRIDLLPYFVGVAVFSLAATLFISWMTTGGHALKVSRTSPIHALRYE